MKRAKKDRPKAGTFEQSRPGLAPRTNNKIIISDSRKNASPNLDGGGGAAVKDDKIQTGLRIPQVRYEELRVMAERSGTSLNGLILFLVDIGLTAVNRSAEKEDHSLPRNL